MDSQFLGIVTLLRSALKNETLALPAGFDLSGAVPILLEHHLVGMAVRGIARCGVSRSNPAVQQLTAVFCKTVAASRLQLQQLNVVFSLFQENGIEYMPVKGAILKKIYPQSELRVMGDADVLIRQDQYPAIRELLSSLGLQEDAENDHEYVWHGGEFNLELHKRLVPSHDKDYFAYYGDGWKFAKRVGQSSEFCMSPEDHFIFLLVHFAKHYRNASINAKNVCDFWVQRKAYPELDEAYICAELEKLKLLDFYKNILELLDVWFEGAASTATTDLITNTVFQGGLYSQLTVSIIKSSKEEKAISKSKYQLIWKKLFPAARVLAKEHPVLKKHPVLLPFFWVAQWFELLFFRHDRIKRGLDVMQLDANRLSDYEEQLRTVGLGFNFSE